VRHGKLVTIPAEVTDEDHSHRHVHDHA
jgi:hypothetical protein